MCLFFVYTFLSFQYDLVNLISHMPSIFGLLVYNQEDLLRILFLAPVVVSTDLTLTPSFGKIIQLFVNSVFI